MFGTMTPRIGARPARGWRQWWCGFLLMLLIGGLNPALAREEAQGATAAIEQGLLWQIVSPASGKTSYLFGTIHSEDPRVTRLAPTVQTAFDQSKQFVMEVIPDGESMLAVSQSMMLGHGTSLRAMAGQELFDKTSHLLGEMGMPPEVADRMKPWAVMIILSMPKSRTGLVLDLLLYRAAVKAGKGTAGLETAEEQLAIFDALPQAEQLALLEDAVAQYPQMEGIMEQMHLAYLARDLRALADMNEKYGTTGNVSLTRKINDALVDRRNRRMAERMETYLREGGVFVAVGALHLPAEQGLLQLLRERGYRVTSIY